jgi:hypothetical protein
MAHARRRSLVESAAGRLAPGCLLLAAATLTALPVVGAGLLLLTAACLAAYFRPWILSGLDSARARAASAAVTLYERWVALVAVDRPEMQTYLGLAAPQPRRSWARTALPVLAAAAITLVAPRLAGGWATPARGGAGCAKSCAASPRPAHVVPDAQRTPFVVGDGADRRVVVHASRSRGSNALGVVQPPGRILVICRETDWYLVEWREYESGWVPASDVRPATAHAKPVAVCRAVS